MGVSSGFKYLDRAINGFRPQHLYLLSAAPESGKTAFLLNLLLNITVKKKILLLKPFCCLLNIIIFLVRKNTNTIFQN
ncbi:MAG: hypothetical protein KGZ74_01580 [Chitinophagaceae bacterium]|nr:hypothetical protein [Chitinophagaceae bacterium]